MKPIKLTMQAFGPYKYKEVIDFEDLKNNQLFVISGNTGAGKTTIFDGIAFALYGHASGEDRKEHKSMRSDFAEDDTHTLVELIFETRGKKYRVLRQLAHIKTGRKTASGENYEFMELLHDGTEVHACEKQKSKEISQKIEEIIGLTYDQFHQIVMLPQGEFRKLLTSSTENKEVILRKIFKTERYSKIAERLESKKKQAEKQRDEAKAIRNLYIDQITGALPRRESLLFERLTGEANIYQIVEGLQEEKAYYEVKQAEDELVYVEAQKAYTAHQQQLTMIQQQNERLQKLEQKQTELVLNEQQKPTFEALKLEAEQASVALQIAGVFEALQTVSSELQQQQLKATQFMQQLKSSENDLQSAKQQFEFQQQTEDERKALEQSVRELQKVEPLFAKVDELELKITHTAAQQQVVTEQMEQCNAQLKDSNNRVEQLVMVEEQLDVAVQQLPEKLLQQQTQKQQLLMLQQFEQAQSKILQQQLMLQQQKQNLDIATENYHQLERSWLNNQALELVAHLVEGDACPVCGSTVHELPHLEVDGQTIPKDALATQKNKVDQLSRAYYGADATLKAALEQQQLLQQQLAEQQLESNKQEYYKQQHSVLVQEIRDLQFKQSELQQAKEERKTIQEQMKQFQARQTELVAKQQQLTLTIETKKVELIAIRQQIPSEYSTSQTLKQAIQQQQARYEILVQAFTTTQKAYELATTKVTQLQEANRQIQEHLVILQQKQQQQKTKWQQALQDSPFSSQEQFREAIRTRMQIEEMQQRYVAFTNNLFALQQFVAQELKELQQVKFMDVSELQQQLVEGKKKYEEAYHMLTQSQNNITLCQQYEESLKNIAEKIIKLEEIANSILNLYNVLRGQNTKKISFERYVQIGYLEQITEAANVRLRHLSNGQYQLMSSERQVGHGRQSGLSLDVYDSYTGQTRDVKTLSGGEKFNASLCLALGMADVIQGFQGNVRIDTMFIDEGFGSLDEESLMRAIDTLIDLQKSGRMIGVISHVAELKAAIPAVLEVMKLKEGFSKTKFTIK